MTHRSVAKHCEMPRVDLDDEARPPRSPLVPVIAVLLVTTVLVTLAAALCTTA